MAAIGRPPGRQRKPLRLFHLDIKTLGNDGDTLLYETDGDLLYETDRGASPAARPGPRGVGPR